MEIFYSKNGKEIWKDIPEYKGLYQVSSKGRIKSIACYKNGFDYIGFEKDPYYYELANKRLEEYKAQITLFDLGLERNPSACEK